jgi:hypothetical protein
VSLIRQWAEHTAQKTGLHNPAGYMVNGIKSGKPPANARDPARDRHRKYATPGVKT